MQDKNSQGGYRNFLEIDDRRVNPEPIIRVWDVFVRTSHWLLVLFFAIIYLRYRKFPLHAYAGMIVLGLVTVRLVWGFVGPRAARFKTFLFTPAQVFRYALDALRGHAAYFSSHNPLGAWMVFILLLMMFANGILGLMLYSAGQQLGPLGDLVPSDWEDQLILYHKVLGHITAASVALHISGVVWAARAHHFNFVTAMITGYKRVPRKADEHELEGYSQYSDRIIPPRFAKVERWFNRQHPALGSILLVGAVALVVLELVEAFVNLNKYLPTY